MDKLFIGATAKSGTHYTTEFLNRLGIRVGHEYPSFDGMVSWYIYNPPNEYPQQFNFNQDQCICLHQVREPLECISSIMRLDEPSWRYIRRWMQMDLSRPLLERCMEYYYYWNKSLENCAHFYPVEDILELIEILDLFEVKYDKSKIDYALSTPRLGITNNKKELSWNDLYKENKHYHSNILEMANNYGYT